MRYQIVPTSNVSALLSASDQLLQRGMGMPGMGLIHGYTGYGKTTAATWLINRVHGVYVRVLALSTPASFLGSLCDELGLARKRSLAGNIEQIVERLADTGRPVFVDEADYLLRSSRMVETLRDIHDLSTVPVILIGEEGLERKITTNKRLTRRIAEWVEFKPATLTDARMLANALLEHCDVADDLLEKLHDQAKGSTGLLVVGLDKVEKKARRLGIDHMDLKAWGSDTPFVGNAPRAAKVVSLGG